MAGIKNGTLIGNNADFTQAGGTNAASGQANGLLTDGQLWVGSTALNIGGTHINVGSIVSPDSSITFGYSSPNITAQVSGSYAAVLSLTGNTGVATPSSGNINVVTANTTVKFTGSGSTITEDFNVNNLVIGTSAPLISTGTANVGIGALVMGALTSGAGNTAVGHAAANGLTTGQSNVAIGRNSLLNMTVSAGNVAVGTNSLILLTTSVGSNTAVGHYSLGSTTTGSLNIGIGNNAGVSLSGTDSSNILLGSLGAPGDNNTIKIGSVTGASAGQQNKTFIRGILGVTNPNNTLVTQNSSTEQLGATTSTYPNTNAINTILYASSANTMAALATANSGVLTTSTSGVPSIDATNFKVLTTGVQVKGNNTNTAPPAGFLGEQIINTATAVAMVSGTAKTITSITLTPGVWDVSFLAGSLASGGTNIINAQVVNISTTDNTVVGTVGIETFQTNIVGASVGVSIISGSVPALRFLVSSLII